MPNRKEPRLKAEDQDFALDSASEFSTEYPPETEAAPSSSSLNNKAVKDSAVKGSAGKAWLGIFLALIALGVLAWQHWQGQATTLQLVQQLAQQQAAMQQLTQRTQELESVLSATGADLSAAGKKLNDKLEWADSEIRKLWVVAHQRNRPAIEALESKAKQLEQGLSKADEQNLGLVKDLNTYKATLKASSDELNVQIKALTQRLTEVSLTASTLDERLRDQDLRTSVASLEKRVAELIASTSAASSASTIASTTQAQPDAAQVKQLEALTAQVAEQQEILTSLEASRGQLVGRVTRLMDDVRVLQQRR